MHRIDKYLKIPKELNLDYSYQRPEIPISKVDSKYMSEFFKNDIKESVPIIVIHPCTSKFGSFKQWPIINYAMLADMIKDKYKANVIFTWGPKELGVVNEIASKMKHKAIVACETKSIKQLIELIRHTDIFVSGDTGPLHIASTLDIPTAAIFGPKDPVIYGPYNDKAIVVRKELPCSPCTKRKCSKPECMTTILPEDVFEAVNNLMKRYVCKKDPVSPSSQEIL